MKAAGQHRPIKWRRAVVIVLVASAIGAGAWLLHQKDQMVSSDDATLDAEVVHIASTVGGRISRIAVKENTSVRAGEELFQIDPEPLQLAVNQAEADLALARATLATQQRGVHTQRSAVSQATDQTRRAQTNLALAQRTVERLRPLAAKGYVPQQQLDQAETAERDAQTSLRQAQEQARAAGHAVGTDDAGLATVRAREAALGLARHALASATVRAPHDGRVVGLTVTSGEIVVPSQSLFTLVVSNEWSAVANMRESDLSKISEGDCATVYSMIDRRKALRGTVQGIGAGVLDADRIALPRSLPYVQKSMNWVRVAQRFPVRIELNEPPDSLMRLGASAVVEIRHGSACP
ncbi:multidrug transporter subunit MdtN [Ottowia thiooxydans]|uniref:Multidrug efflux system membrane fusion protein n=1 Tax=Ottowia thiooxydans TaxID=219182 RepID=A0ABV2QD04_9BURK